MKSVLVIDTPSSCQECRLLDDDNWYCMGYHEACDLSGIHNRPSWCPLMPMPDKKYVLEEYLNNFGAGRYGRYEWEAFKIGWNACIEEIEDD